MNTEISLMVTPLDQITPEDESCSGSKAYNCALLKQAGFLVPDGIVVLATATNVDAAAVSEHSWFDALPADTLFAVRSSGIGEDSAGQSFAGIHQTLLDVPRADLARAVMICRASALSPHALEYRRAQGLPLDGIQMGVLIQRMIHPIAAGVAFTVNPVSGAGNELVINSSWGVGEALVSGQVDPDEFVIRKSDRELLWTRAGGKGQEESSPILSLTSDQVRELAGILLDIERHYGTPQDVEWCHDGSVFWIVQSRPITTGPAAPNSIEWSRANLAEVLPDLTSPQALAVFEEMLNRAERQYLGKLIEPDEQLGPILKSFNGRLYFNLSQMRHLCALLGQAPAELLRSMGHADTIQPADEKTSKPSIGKLLPALPDLFRMLWRHRRPTRIIRAHEAKTHRNLTRLTVVNPNALSDRELWDLVEEWIREAPDYTQTVLLLGGVMIHEGPVRQICDKAGFAYERLVYPQLAAGERSVSAQQAFDLVALADTARREPAVAQYLLNGASGLSEMRSVLRGTEFLKEFENFLETYGHRGIYESDWSLPRYCEDPTPLLQALRIHVEHPSEKQADETIQRQERESAEAWAAFEKQLSLIQRWITLPRIRRAIRKIKQYYVWREKVRSDLVKILAAMRKLHLVLADRFVERGWLEHRDDYFLIRLEEIATVIDGKSAPETLRALAEDRIMETARNRSIQMPLLMRESELAALIRTSGISSRSSEDGQMTGHPVSGGCVEAEVVVVHDPSDFDRMKRGAILVAPATDPSWTPLFTLASGVIVEVGGVLSHASTVAREYGIPALANVKHATKRLKTGERVRLDAIHGFVEKQR